MHRQFRHSRWLLAILLASTLYPASLFAATEDSDVAEIEHYTLTMSKVTSYWETMGDLAKLAGEHPELSKSMESDTESHETIPDIEKRISSSPLIKNTITEHGFSLHEFVVLQLALFQSAMAGAMIPSGPDRLQKAAAAHVNPANLEFIDQHKPELEAMQKKYMPKEE